MASAKFEGGKCKGSLKVKAFFRHDEKVQRLSHEHTNEHIDKSKTHLNTSAYGLSYKEACMKYDKRIAELDATTNVNKRKDRVTMQSIEIPVPEGLAYISQQAFFDNVKEILCAMFGEINLIEAFYHYDEGHEYIDPETKEKKMSRNHGHYNFVPEVDGQLNGKAFSSRANMKKLNGAIDKMCQMEFGVLFMDGTKKKGKKTVEQLKNESKEAELIQQMQTDLESKETILRAQASKYLDAKKKWKEAVIEAEIELAQQQYNQDSIIFIQSQREEELDNKQVEIEKQQEEIDKQKAELSVSDTAKLQRAYAVSKKIKLTNGMTVYDEIQRQEKIHQENIRLLLHSPIIKEKSKDYDFCL